MEPVTLACFAVGCITIAAGLARGFSWIVDRLMSKEKPRE